MERIQNLVLNMNAINSGTFENMAHNIRKGTLEWLESWALQLVTIGQLTGNDSSEVLLTP